MELTFAKGAAESKLTMIRYWLSAMGIATEMLWRMR